MEIIDRQINDSVNIAINSENVSERKEAIEIVFERLKPFRYSLAKKFANKGVSFDDIAQQIDLKLLEAIYDYDEERDPSALRHLVSRARNGIWNYYRKEMNYFNESRITVSFDALTPNRDTGYGTDQSGGVGTYYDFIDDKNVFDESAIIEKLLLEDELLKLTPHQREVLLMYYVDDRTQYSIAEELNINQANVSRAKQRGVKSMRDNISPSGAHGGTL